MKKKNVLYFTSLALDSPNNGGTICSLNHISKLSQDPRINLSVVAIGQKIQEEAVKIQLNKFEITYYFVPVYESKYPWHSWPKLKKIKNIFRIKFPFMLEIFSFNQEHISKKLIELCKSSNIDVVVVEYLYSILLFPEFLKIQSKKVLITQNREADLYQESLNRDRVYKYKLNFIQGIISHLRLKLFEEKINRSVDKYVALTEADIPRYLARKGNAVVIPPTLEPKSKRWNYTETRTIFFIGSCDHYPNYLAIDWILCKLAPILLKLDPTIKIEIAGKLPDRVPDSWRMENVELLGFVSLEKSESLFTTADLFICPTEHQYGVKIKVIECVAYGTPFLATKTALESAPYLSDIPLLDIDRPDDVAHCISNLLANPEALQQLNQKLSRSISEYALSEQNLWHEVIFE
jgi:glycosyltransferase involved in cell wall biosynthesis